MIKNGLAESQPEIQQAQPAGKSAHEAAGNYIAQRGGSQQQRIVRPSRSPGENQQQDPESRAQRNEQQRPHPQQPHPRIAGGRTRFGRVYSDAGETVIP